MNRLATMGTGRRTHRPAGAGTLEQLPSGRWRFRLTGPDGKRRTSPSFALREEAQRVLDAATAELGAAGIAPVGPVTLGGYAEAWLGRRNVRSIEDERRLWRGHVAGTALAAMSIAEVRRKHVRDFLSALARKRKLIAKKGGQRGERVESDDYLSRQTVKLVLSLLHRILEEAILDEVLETNPARGHRLPRPVVDADAEEKWTFLTAAEIDQLFDCPNLSAKAHTVFEVAIFTGLRQGELWGLRWGDLTLDAERPEAVARHSYEGPTKAGKLRRFPLLPRAAQALRRLREQSADTSPEALVFPSPRGGMHGEGYDAGWSTYSRAKAGIRREVVFHSFRHTCASHLLQGTWGRAWSLAEVRDYLGHSSVTVTERYAHLQPGRLHELASATSCGVTTDVTTDAGEEAASTENRPDRAAFLNSRSRVRTAPRSFERGADASALCRARRSAPEPSVAPGGFDRLSGGVQALTAQPRLAQSGLDLGPRSFDAGSSAPTSSAAPGRRHEARARSAQANTGACLGNRLGETKALRRERPAAPIRPRCVN